jgi:hypothetical protein
MDLTARRHKKEYIMSRVGKSKNNIQWYRSKLDGIGPHASKSQRDRFELAVAYLETHCKKINNGKLEVDRQKVLDGLNSIDFHKPVELETIKPGQQLARYSEKNAEVHGDFFTDPGVQTQRLGIAQREEHNRLTVKQDMVVLKSHSRCTVDTWSKNRAKSVSVYTRNKATQLIECKSGEYVRGGGVQYHIPRSEVHFCRHNFLTPAKRHGISR